MAKSYAEHKAKLVRQGYQEALGDIAIAFNQGGFEKVAEWLKDNTTERDSGKAIFELVQASVVDMQSLLSAADEYRDEALRNMLDKDGE